MASSAPPSGGEQLKRSAALGQEVDGLDRDGILVRADRSPFGRRLRLVNALLSFVLAGVLLTDAWLAYDTFFGDWRTGDGVGSAHSEPSHQDLDVFDDAGTFGGRITIVNPLHNDIEVFVDVDIYDGEQHVGELFGSVTLKPDSESVVDLDGYDDYVPFTESRVHLSGWPK